MLDTDDLGGAGDAFVDLRLGQAPRRRLQRELQVLAHRIARVERVLLQHQGDVALGRSPGVDVLVVDADRARIGALQSRDQPQRGGFAGAGRAKQDEELAVLDLERQVFERRVALEGLGNARELDVRHLSHPSRYASFRPTRSQRNATGPDPAGPRPVFRLWRPSRWAYVRAENRCPVSDRQCRRRRAVR